MQEGSVHTVKVIRMMDFGAIVEFPSGSNSLLHISQISHTRVSLHALACPLVPPPFCAQLLDPQKRECGFDG